jgi:hypothetical protein
MAVTGRGVVRCDAAHLPGMSQEMLAVRERLEKSPRGAGFLEGEQPSRWGD